MFLQIFDSFFYISLAITFGLILLMVFHFKNRIYSLEEKNKDLSELCQTMIQELQHIKLIQQYNYSTAASASNNHHHETYDDTSDDSDDSDTRNPPVFKKITVLDSILQSNSSDEYETETIEQELYQESEDMEELAELDLDNYSDIDNVPDLVPDTTHDTSVEQLLKTIELDTLDIDASILETIQVTKSTEETETEMDMNELDARKPPMKKNPYVKMNLQMLRTTVISKGLCSDASKLKKPELIEMLMNHDHEQHT
jgi:hypothetical protein